MIEDNDALGLLQRLARRVFIDRPLAFDIHRLGMADENRHAHASRRDRDLGIEIFLVSTTIFHSSLVEPSSMKMSICGITLNAICLVNSSGFAAR